MKGGSVTTADRSIHIEQVLAGPPRQALIFLYLTELLVVGELREAYNLGPPVDRLRPASGEHPRRGSNAAEIDRVLAVLACDEDVLPLAARLATATDMNELHEVHETKRHLLYVAVTRARDEPWVSGVAPGSDYLADL